MWKSRRVTSPRDRHRRKPHHGDAYEPATAITDEENADLQLTVQLEDEEKQKLFHCSHVNGIDGGFLRRQSTYTTSSFSICTLPSRAAVASRDIVANLHAFLRSSFKKLPPLRMSSHLRSCGDAVKRKCAVTLGNPALCFRFHSHAGHEKYEDTIPDSVRAELYDLGIHIRTVFLYCHRRFSLADLQKATSHFAEKNILGKGSSGCVYRGQLAFSSFSIAVKVINAKSRDARVSFATELEIMCQVQNCHIQPLLGYCIEDGHLFLVYTYMPQGSLEAWLHGSCHGKLSWSNRCKVAIGIVKALSYLHTECKIPVIHRDVKSSNILLTMACEPKLTDFGLAIQAPLPNDIRKDVMGTFGYLAPEYLQHGKVSTKIDIYALGIVLLELVTGRCAIEKDVSRQREGNLAKWATNIICQMHCCSDGIADPELGASYSPRGLRKILYIAALCIHPYDIQRPSITKVLEFMLEEPNERLHRLVLEAYRDLPFISYDCLPFSEDQCNSVLRRSGQDVRKQYLDMVMSGMEELDSLFESPLLVQ